MGMTLEAGKEMDRRCVWNWLNDVYRNPKVAFNTYSDEQQIEFAHDALVLLKEQEAVVHCGDCENFCFDNVSPNAGRCMLTNMTHSKTWFCAHGKREEGR